MSRSRAWPQAPLLARITACSALGLSCLVQALRAQQPNSPTGLSQAEVEEIVAAYLSTHTPTAGPTQSSALDQLKVSGDLRLRDEYSFALFGKRDRNRLRLRLRLGASISLSDELELGARLRTGDPDDPNSPHVTFGDAFDSLDISLDRAYLTYRPNWAGDSFLSAGKFNHAFQRNPVYGELVWDADIQTEGLAIGHSHHFDNDASLQTLGIQAGIYPLIEQGSGSDAALAALELNTAIRLGDELSGKLSAAYYHYNDTSPSGSTALLADNAGNRSLDTSGNGKPDTFASHFGILHGIASLTYRGLDQPLTIGGEWIHNRRAAMHTDDTGWALGIAYGTSRAAGDLRYYYQWQVVQREAVFTAMAQDDFLLASNHRSHIFGINYQARNDVGIHLWGLVSTQDTASPGIAGADHDQWRLRLDFNVKF